METLLTVELLIIAVAALLEIVPVIVVWPFSKVAVPELIENVTDPDNTVGEKDAVSVIVSLPVASAEAFDALRVVTGIVLALLKLV